MRSGVRGCMKLVLLMMSLYPLTCIGQSVSSGSDLNADVLEQLRQLSVSLEKTQAQLAESQSEIRELRAKIDSIEARERLSSGNTQQSANASATAGTEQANAPPARISEDDWQVLNARVDEQHQTKVESASKFRVKLSGLLLMNAFTASGRTDQVDLPQIATPLFAGIPTGYSGASFRQSILGLTGYGPEFLGARTSGDIQMDFFGGLSNTFYGMTGGIARLRTGQIRLDWENTSASAGLEKPLFSPLSPTSYLTVAEPALSSAGNMWTWTPQIRAEHRFNFDPAQLKVEAGVMDPISVGAVTNTYQRLPTPGENSRQPAYALRISGGTKSEDRPFLIGIGGFYSPQEFRYGYRAHNWASTLDWQFGLLKNLQLSGEFFTGKGMEGFGGVSLGAVPPTSYYNYTYITLPELDQLTGIGGWGQIKYQLNSRNEFNVAGGYGGLNSTGLRNLAATNVDLATLPARNQTFFANYILRPRSDLLFSVEYRHLRTFGANNGPDTTDIVGLAAGFLF